MPKVLVTGGTGFIASHCIELLLGRGYEVITTVRSPEKGARVLDAFSAQSKPGLSYQVVKDVAQKDAFDEVIKSTPNLDFVLHSASPFHYDVQDPIKDFLEPAINGVTGILYAIKSYAPSVKRVVFTSSFAAINGGSKEDPPFYDESSWSPVTWEEAANNKKAAYRGSKALAERAAWDFMKNEKPAFDLVALNPSLGFGPVAPYIEKGEVDKVNTSNLRIVKMLRGEMKEKLDPTGFYTWVDVRDIAKAHVEAFETPEAGNNRFLILAGYQSNRMIAEIIAKMGPQFKEKLPEDLDKAADGDDFPAPDKRYRFDATKVAKVLGIEYTSLEKSVKDTVDSLVKLGL